MPTLDDLIETRRNKLNELNRLGINPYPASVKRDQTIAQAIVALQEDVAVVGRIIAFRGHGKIYFLDIQDETGKIQIALKVDICKKEPFEIIGLLDIADIISVQGRVEKTQAGEVTVFATDFQIITKSLRPLPDKWHGLKDVEERYRKRYLDTILNSDVKNRLTTRSYIIDSIRDFLTDRDFLEVETPTLQPVYGGGFARPFSTHHNALDANFYLRISDEMYLKRLIVGGFEKVFEITKVFRNEGVDHDHNPEFTMLEAQIAYEDYRYGMDIIEEIIEYCALRSLGSTKFTYQGILLDVKHPWERYSMVEAIKKFSGLDPTSWESIDDAKKDIMGLEIPERKLAELHKMKTIGEMIAFTFEETVEEKLIQPTIIYDYPIEVSPLAKKCTDPRFTQRFEMFAFGSELGNNYSELNDPIDLRKRFVEEKKREEAGFDEAHQTDYDYLEAIEHGFPPTCGIAIGIDRLVMMLTDAKSIKEVIPFPTLRPENASEDQQSDGYDYRERKIVAILSTELSQGNAANALGHMAVSAGRYLGDSWMGESAIKDADGISHIGISKYPFIILGASSQEIKNIVVNAKESKLFTVDYPQEMFDTNTDQDLIKALSKVKSDNLVYQAVLIAGKTDEVGKFTKGLHLFKQNTTSQESSVVDDTDVSPSLSKAKALELLHGHMQNMNLRRHCYAVGYAMRALAEKLGGNADVWEVLGILHDADWEETKDVPEDHTKKTLQWLSDMGITTGPLVNAMKSHNRKLTKLAEIESVMEWALETVDELTGFIVAVALVRPDPPSHEASEGQVKSKLQSVEISSIMKKWKTKEFAKPVDRDHIAQCEEKLGIPLAEFIEITLHAMQANHEELGL